MNGIILVDKPQDWTSHDVVAKLRGVLHERRIGHSGTLDPLATGLLVVFVGRATRAVEFSEADSKEYLAGLRLGVSTDTQDITGNVIAKCDALPDEAAVRETLCRFIGDIEQIPPMYSAIKIQAFRCTARPAMPEMVCTFSGSFRRWYSMKHRTNLCRQAPFWTYLITASANRDIWSGE